MPERLLDNPKHWRDLEEETRSLAELMYNSETKRRLLKTADEYRHLAELAEQRVEEKDWALVAGTLGPIGDVA